MKLVCWTFLTLLGKRSTQRFGQAMGCSHVGHWSAMDKKGKSSSNNSFAILLGGRPVLRMSKNHEPFHLQWQEHHSLPSAPLKFFRHVRALTNHLSMWEESDVVQCKKKKIYTSQLNKLRVFTSFKWKNIRSVVKIENDCVNCVPLGSMK